ncbi:hypothetical protein [Streptomyces scopuliridis]|uniref:hypothetical protein n=1 Tax=Streptomyces scopuliridis TaxID=452529 RepID=UPI0036AF871F
MIPAAPLIEMAVGLLLTGTGCVWLARIGLRTRKPDPSSWIDARITAERDPGRRAAWRTIRDPKGDL